MIKGIIFDCFGVVYLDRFDEIYRHFGGDLDADAELIEKHFFDVSKGTLSSENTVLEDRVGTTKEEWRKKKLEVQGFNQELLKYITELRNNYSVAMLSNIGDNGLKNNLDYSVLEEHFDEIIESAKIGFAKPEARAYEITADKLGLRLDECIFTDDRQPYVEGAQAVGMRAILFKNTEQFKKELETYLNSQ